MSNQLLASKNELFTPRDLVTTPVEGKSFLRLYPKRTIGDVWSELETNLAFNVNCSTLQNSNLKKNVIIETLAEQMGTSTQMHIYLQRYDSLGKNQFYNPANLKVLSYHNKKGAVIEEAIRYVAGIETLKTQALRPQGIHFVKFRCNLDFSSLGVQDSSNSFVDFYACLPITANDAIAPADENNIPTAEEVAALQDSLVQARTALEQAEPDARAAAELAVTTARNAFITAQDLRNTGIAAATARANGANFNGPSSWLTDLNSHDDLTRFLSPHGPTPQLTPFLLSQPAFDSNIAKMDTKAFKNSFDTLVVELAYEPLKKVIFDYVCPSIKNEPFQLFQAVCQEALDPTDPTKRTRISVQQYADIFNGLMRSLSSDSEWLVDVHEYFMKNLASDIREKMESDGYRVHMHSTSKLPFNQIKLMETARQKALHAEKSLHSQAKMIQTQLQNSHSFLTNAEGQPVYLSPAEKTITHYKDSNGKLPPSTGVKPVTCWGCGKNTHRWYDKVLKKVVCPDGTNPAYIKAAALAKKQFTQKVKDRMKAMRERNDPAQKNRRALIEALLSSDGNVIIQNNTDTDADASTISGSTTSTNNRHVTFTLTPSNGDKDTSNPSPTKKIKIGNTCFNLITSASVLNTTNGKEPLPISLHPDLPHIKLLLGEPDSEFNPALLGIIDTGATLTVGYSDYVLGIAESFPQLVKSIVWAEDRYCPIELNGVGSDSNKMGSNTLSAVVTFHMPYLTNNNHSTSLSIAIGKNVAVNVLIGMSFISNAQLIIDPSDKVAEAKMLQCQPFEIIFKQVSRGKPNPIPTEFKPDHAVFVAHEKIMDRIRATREYVENYSNPSDSNANSCDITCNTISDSDTPEIQVHDTSGEAFKSITYAFDEDTNSKV
jgi:hypothetical protein